jgi:CRISPR/Cas system CMR subunit Cmr4 (Cas7 group RAMP superfamily)
VNLQATSVTGVHLELGRGTSTIDAPIPRREEAP